MSSLIILKTVSLILIKNQKYILHYQLVSILNVPQNCQTCWLKIQMLCSTLKDFHPVGFEWSQKFAYLLSISVKCSAGGMRTTSCKALHWLCHVPSLVLPLNPFPPGFFPNTSSSNSYQNTNLPFKHYIHLLIQYYVMQVQNYLWFSCSLSSISHVSKFPKKEVILQ